jgi:hypothetical protein
MASKTDWHPFKKRRASQYILVSALLGLPFLAPGQALPSQTQRVKIAHDTFLTFETVQKLDSGTAKVGDDVPLRLACPLVIGGPINGTTVLPVGTEVHGKVAQVTHAGRNKTGARCGGGRLAIDVQQIIFPDRSTAKVHTIERFRPHEVFSLTADLTRADWWTVKHPINSLSSNLGPIPLIFVALTPIFVATEAVDRSLLRPIRNIATVSKRKRPCPTPVDELVVLPGSAVTVLIIGDHTVHL